MKMFYPRVPSATEHNAEDFCVAWMMRWGGDGRNARRVYEVERLRNQKRDLSCPFHESKLKETVSKIDVNDDVVTIHEKTSEVID